LVSSENRDSSSYYDSPARSVCLNSGDNLLLVSTVADCLGRGRALRPNPTPSKQNPEWVFVFAPCRFCDLINTAPPPTLWWASRGQSAPKIAPTYQQNKKDKRKAQRTRMSFGFPSIFFWFLLTGPGFFGLVFGVFLCSVVSWPEPSTVFKSSAKDLDPPGFEILIQGDYLPEV
jgi:hypothetical protein